MKLSILKLLNVCPYDLSSRVFELPSGAQVELNVLEDALRVVAPGPYPIEVGHLIAEDSRLEIDDMRFLARMVLGIPSERDVRVHGDLVTSVLPFLTPLFARSIETDSAFLIAVPSSRLLPILFRGQPAALLPTQIARARATGRPVVSLVQRAVLAGIVAEGCNAVGADEVCRSLRDTELRPTGAPHAVTSLHDRVGYLLLDSSLLHDRAQELTA